MSVYVLDSVALFQTATIQSKDENWAKFHAEKWVDNENSFVTTEVSIINAYAMVLRTDNATEVRKRLNSFVAPFWDPTLIKFELLSLNDRTLASNLAEYVNKFGSDYSLEPIYIAYTCDSHHKGAEVCGIHQTLYDPLGIVMAYPFVIED